ncbi:GNAT family N-acetyltransferase [Tianweitania sediminis]|jgi:predicted N-acetyltransferase YhbS|uniref:N-acetyltransferase n=1 Tax=Tianweitania sediminis TaxID=1502156 RepID=A0A8J7R2S0_9HYPH|nr:N-acetyltransferase [Tianweitania sediminis]MBP0439381.1 N-acetyltransferase [Tianweitania sediminis]HEV7414760.1 N-acetyltransferase [Tianweitania sediminis]
MVPGSTIAYLPETAEHDPEIELINEEAFGPGRFARAASKIREGGPHDRALSFVAASAGTVIGSVRLTPIAAGRGRGHMLGPLAVRPAFKNAGIGRTLVALGLDAARKAGSPLVMLVGDAPYYGPLGFARMPRNQVQMPRPVDPDRLLVCEFTPGAAAQLTGDLDHVDQIVRSPKPFQAFTDEAETGVERLRAAG